MRTIKLDYKKSSSVTVRIPEDKLDKITIATKNLAEKLKCEVTRNSFIEHLISDSIDNSQFEIDGNVYTFDQLYRNDIYPDYLLNVQSKSSNNNENTKHIDNDFIIYENEIFKLLLKNFINDNIYLLENENNLSDISTCWKNYLDVNDMYEVLQPGDLKSSIYNADLSILLNDNYKNHF